MSSKTTRADLQGFIEELKKEILEETRKAYGEKAFDRWRNPIYGGPMENPDGYACLRSSCGDSMELFLQFDGDRVSRASFRAAGCGASAVCGSYAAELALHKGPNEILQVTGESILARLDGLPREEEPMAALAANTLHAALQDFILKRESKKRDTLK